MLLATKPRKRTAHEGNFNHAHDFVVMNPTIVDNSILNYHTLSDREVKGETVSFMNTLRTNLKHT
jgi:hypothetical protein